MPPYPIREYIPGKPFAAFIEARVAFHERGQQNRPASHRDGPKKVAEEFGWGSGDAGVRKLYRYRHGLHSVRPGGKRGSPSRDVPTERVPRPLVEDALARAGVDFYEVYTEFAHERDIEIEPAAWCPNCQEHVTPIKGECPWDGWRISEGHMNRAAA